MRRVIKQPLVSEQSLLKSDNARPKMRRSHSSSIFQLDEEDQELRGFDDELPTLDTLEHLTALLQPRFTRHSFQIRLTSAFQKAWGSCKGCLHRLTAALHADGFSARVAQNSSAIFSLPHAFVTVAYDNCTFIVDPYFKDNWEVPTTTTRYQAVLEKVPQFAVAPLPRLLEAAALLSEELERCFRKQDFSLPPWRMLQRTLSRWSTTPCTTTATMTANGNNNNNNNSSSHPSAAAQQQPTLGVAKQGFCLPPRPHYHEVHDGFQVSISHLSVGACDCCGPRRSALRQFTRGDVAAVGAVERVLGVSAPGA